jgi:HlyD family secretion protein
LNRFLKRPWILGAGVVVVAIAAYLVISNLLPHAHGRFDIETADAKQGDVRRKVSTSGTVKAFVQVDVGSQLSGQIIDVVDFNTRMKANDVIAQLDPTSYKTKVNQAQAQVKTAAAQVNVQTANITRSQASLLKAKADYERASNLKAKGALAVSDYDTALANYKTAEADVDVANANLENAKASLTQSQAMLDSANVDLDHTTIRAPIDGIVIDRKVEKGQTVAAAMTTPVIATLAGDLSKVEIDAQVDEADIGQVKEGQTVAFTVGAFPNERFQGAVDQIRLAALSQSNVVTYTVVISAPNPREELLPGMTADVEIVTGERSNVLTVDNRAIRFEPRGTVESLLTGDGKTTLAAIRARSSNNGFPGGGGFGGPPGGGARPAGGGGGAGGARPQGGGGGGPQVVIIGGPGGPPGGGGGQAGQGRGFAGGMVSELKSRLNLSDSQVEQIQTAMRASFQSLQTGGGAPDRAAMRKTFTSAIEGALTPDQVEKFHAIQSELEAGGDRVTVWVQTGSGELAPRRVVLGVSDSTVSEVVAGELKAGEKVVVRAREAATT